MPRREISFPVIQFFFAMILAFAAPSPALSSDLKIGGVPLPASATPGDGGGFEGVWAGTWDHFLNHILVVESVDASGAASVIYAWAGNPARGFEGGWVRRSGRVEGDVLFLTGDGPPVRYALGATGRLRGVFRDDAGFTVLSRRDLAAMRADPSGAWWRPGALQRLKTDLNESGGAVNLNVVVQSPPGDGPFPLAMIHHGSTGDGTDVAARGWIWSSEWLADMLNERGWIVAFPQRRGRGGSDGLYDEGFTEDRKMYSGDAARSIAGAERALSDAEAALAALRLRSDVADGPVFLGGMSRGGALALMQAGARPDDVSGVANFVGGWLSEGYGDSGAVNADLFGRGAAYDGPVISFYGEDDPFYSVDFSRRNIGIFNAAGGDSAFVEVEVNGEGNGHYVLSVPSLWEARIGAFLDQITP